MKFFNVAGPCRPERHYMLPPVERLPEVRDLIEDGQYFVLRSPGRSGKTTVLAALARELNAEGAYAAVHFSFKVDEPIRDGIAGAEAVILASLRSAARAVLPRELAPPAKWPETLPGRGIREAISAWAKQCPLPLVLLFDGIDMLRGKSLRSVLAQLREGYTSDGGRGFAHSMVLCGVRDVSRLTVILGDDPACAESVAPFNIVAASLCPADFTAAQVAELYSQHTTETGQGFTPEAVEKAYIQAGVTPLDSLTDTLDEPRVPRVITRTTGPSGRTVTLLRA